ncbi:cellulose-binding protein [Micromonospora craterilacus]|uniref:Cellulose-binding protein n=1 Tax=Micromonospora craterilacus TaxID=1655439 RepID=A0A2W2F977_9ACTN|nr:lytic polysaccharide monooxygenase [Micromonospora craterilacus]PZG12244.1 cellulose-binding protein [Micromonospora craterilacus]
MSNLLRSSRALWLLAVAATATLLLTTALANPASAHGSVINPASRNYGCWDRWGGDFQNPRMATEDPMCWQAWQANPNAMWNWNGLFREGVAGNHQGAIPNGQLCSGGRTEGGRYNALDTVGAWRTTSISNNFRVKFFDQASHGADYIRVYVTRQGYDALTQPLAWSNLELVGQIGNTPASQWQRESGGVSIEIPANAPGRTGRHIVYTIWQASHLDQSYYICSDVQFGGGTTPPPTNPPAGACAATYRVTNSWSGGFQGEVQVTAGSAAIRGWRVTWTYANGQQISQAWNATVSSSGSAVTATNVSYNGGLGAGASTTFGFLASNTGTNSTPTLTCTATT